MKPTRRRTILAVGAVVLLVALVSAGCGRRAQPADAGAAPAATPATAPEVAGAPSALPAADASVSPVSTATPAATPAATRTTATPVPTPDLAGIETLITEIGQDLDADASAGTNEGSPQ